MNLEQLAQLDWVAIGTCAAAVSGAIVATISAIVSASKTRKLEKALDAAKARETFAICPRCKKKVLLSELQFHLPSGARDNNLNGVDDSLESL